jgi:tetratricopeptide (TPR) repeat protein
VPRSSAQPGPGRHAFSIACGLALLVTCTAYANHFHNEFHFDDAHTILNNAFVRNVRNIPLFFTSAATFSSLPSNQSYRPLVTTTLAIDYWMAGGPDPLAFHVTSFVLFVIQCALLLVFYRRVMDLARPDERNRWIALLAAAWYAVHPANAETVNYIIARTEMLSTLGVVAALVMFGGGGVSRRYHLYLVPAVLGILGKESAAMFAPLLFLYVALFECGFALRDLFTLRGLAATLRVTWPAFLVSIATVLLAIGMEPTYLPGGTSRWHYLLTEPSVFLYYALSLLLPLRLSADTQWPLVTTLLDPRLLAGVAFVAGALTLAWMMSRGRDTQPIAFGVVWFFIALIPTAGVVPLAEPVNDHRMFFPFVGLIPAVVWAGWLTTLRIAPRRLKAAACIAVAAIVAMAYGTRQRNIVWRTEESLWLDATIKSPQNGRGLMNYGVIQMGKGNYPVADAYFERALKFTPRYAYLHVNLGVLKAAQGQPREAERNFRQALQDDANNPVSYTYFARWLTSQGRTEEARLFAEQALHLSAADADARSLVTDLEQIREAEMPTAAPPRTPEGWLALAASQYEAHHYEDAIRSSEHALELRPAYAEAFNDICAAEIALGNLGSAADACERALAVEPNYDPARKNLAIARAKAPK